MIGIVKVRKEFLADVRGFCRTFTSVCESCYNRPCNCPQMDIIRRAKGIILRIDNIREAEEERYFVENPRELVYACIIRAIQQAGRPVSSREINLRSILTNRRYYRQHKNIAINQMLRKGLLEMTLVNGKRYFNVGRAYSMKNKTTNK